MLSNLFRGIRLITYGIAFLFFITGIAILYRTVGASQIEYWHYVATGDIITILRFELSDLYKLAETLINGIAKIAIAAVTVGGGYAGVRYWKK